MDSSTNILVTGANGFVGNALCRALLDKNFLISTAIRNTSYDVQGARNTVVGDINPITDWSMSLKDVTIVIHLAARVHVMNDTAEDPLRAFQEVNLYGTINLARQAAAAGVKRFVYVSSIKVNGETTAQAKNDIDAISGSNNPAMFGEDSQPAPKDPYGISKWQAEEALLKIADETSMEVVIIRPPLVYGPNVKGNFSQMMTILRKNIPLPLASVNNLRSLLYVGNLVDALILCATHPAAAGQTYLVSDGADISTPALLRGLGRAMGHPAKLFPCPIILLCFGGRLMGKSSQLERLLGSLRVDSGKIRRELGWIPPYSLEQGLNATVK